ncbi:MAG: helix-turn-helix domain-containing protein [Vulcanimicrobiota bacterium]
MSLCIVQDKKNNLFLPLFYKTDVTLPVHSRQPSPISPYCRYLGKNNMIISYRGKESFFQTHRGVLSIKCAFNGQEFYQSDSGLFSVDESCFLILNEGQRYSSYVSSETDVESFCIFISSSLKEDVLRSFILSDEKLLTEPACSIDKEPVFFEKTFQYSGELRNIIMSLKKSVDNGKLSPGELEDKLHILLERLVKKNSSIHYEADKIPLVKRSARLEIYRRLSIAKDFIDASLREKLAIEDMAEVACLSPHHFLRLFKKTFDMTPHQYIIRKRLERAKKILQISELSVTEIAFEVGFESLSHFSRLFNSYFGVSPRLFRKKKISD